MNCHTTNKAIFYKLLYGAWLTVTVVSLVAMYQLWWTRERAIYFGKSADEQRAIVLERAGIPAQTLELAKQADATWPMNTVYDARGSEVSLSYFKYLVLPRIPSRSESHNWIEEKDGVYSLTSDRSDGKLHGLFSTVDPTPRGLILSAFVLFAIGAGLSRFGISIPEGVACASFMLCSAGLFLKPVCRSYMPVGIFMCGLGIVGTWLAWRSRVENAISTVPAAPLGNWDRFVQWSGVAVLGGSILWAFLMAGVVLPDDWDTWAMWAPKSKIIALSSGPMGDVKYFVPGSGDYPLLWPSVWAFSGWCAGGWEEQWSKGWSALFLALTVWQIKICSERVSGGRAAGWLYAALFVSMPAVPLIASWAYAEAPYWLMLICGLGRLYLWRERNHWGDAVWAGIFAGFAAFTKNEGALFGLLGFLWITCFHGRIGWRPATGYIAVFLALYFSWLAWVKFAIGVQPVGTLGLRVLAPELVLSRLGQGLLMIANMWSDIRQWNIVLFCSLIAAVGGLVWRPRVFAPALFMPIGTGLGSVLVIILREGELGWQIGTAWNRLTIHLLVLLLPSLALGLAKKPTGFKSN